MCAKLLGRHVTCALELRRSATRDRERTEAKFAQLFKAIFQKENAKANKIIEGMKMEKADKYTHGYMAAIKAMLKTRESNDERYFITRLRGMKGDYVRARALLQETRRTHLLTDEDSGYMAAWLDYLDTITESGLLQEKGDLKKGEGTEHYPSEEPTEEESANPL